MTSFPAFYPYCSFSCAFHQFSFPAFNPYYCLTGSLQVPLSPVLSYHLRTFISWGILFLTCGGLVFVLVMNSLFEKYRRYWNPIWGRLFDSLLNIPSCEKQPSLKYFREEFEQFYLADEENYSRHRRSHEVFMF